MSTGGGCGGLLWIAYLICNANCLWEINPFGTISFLDITFILTGLSTWLGSQGLGPIGKSRYLVTTLTLCEKIGWRNLTCVESSVELCRYYSVLLPLVAPLLPPFCINLFHTNCFKIYGSIFSKMLNNPCTLNQKCGFGCKHSRWRTWWPHSL